jgi:HK97 family phage major capsid protein
LFEHSAVKVFKLAKISRRDDGMAHRWIYPAGWRYNPKKDKNMKKLLELRQQRAAKADEMRKLNSENKLETAEGAARFDALDAEIKTLDADILRLERAAELERSDSSARDLDDKKEQRRSFKVFSNTESRVDFKGETWRTPEGQNVPILTVDQRMADFVPAGESAATEIGLSGLLRAMVNGPKSELEKRALAEAAIATGGAQVPTPVAAWYIDLLRQKTTCLQAGVRTVPMTTQTLKMARQISDPAGAWRAENAAIAESDPVFDQVTLTAKTWAFYFRVSRELLEDGQNIETELRNIIAQAGAIGLDQAILTGSGTANQPLGIRGQANIQNISMGVNGAALTGWAKPLDAVAALETANAGNVTAMIMNPRTARTIYGFNDTTGQPLMAPPRLAKIPLLVTNAVPVNETQGTAVNASSIFLGDFNEILVGLRTDLTVSVLQERFADTGQIAFVAWLRADVAAARPAAMARIAGITP